jgi:AcrR family transcriptional regulator
MMTKERILDVAYSMALSDGFSCLKRDDIAAKAGVALGTVNHHWQSVALLRNAVIERAVENEDLKLIAEGIAAGEHAAQAAPQELRLKALTSLAQ